MVHCSPSGGSVGIPGWVGAVKGNQCGAVRATLEGGRVIVEVLGDASLAKWSSGGIADLAVPGGAARVRPVGLK